jgi:hypothetical protein
VGRRRRTFQLKRQLRIDNRSLAPAPRQRSSANRPDDAEAARLSPSQLLLVPGRGLDEEAIEVHVASCAAGIDRTRRCALGSGLTLPAEPARTSERQARTGEAVLEVGTLILRPTYADGCFRPICDLHNAGADICGLRESTKSRDTIETRLFSAPTIAHYPRVPPAQPAMVRSSSRAICRSALRAHGRRSGERCATAGLCPQAITSSTPIIPWLSCSRMWQ